MQLTPFKHDPCAGYPLWGLSAQAASDLSAILLEALLYGTLQEVLALYDEIDALSQWLITDQAIVAYETEMAWEAYDKNKKNQPENPSLSEDIHEWDEDESIFLFDNYSPLLDERLERMTWLRTTQPGRRPSSKRFTRRGRRYRVVQDHGTAARREGIALTHQDRANAHDSTLHWPIALREKAQRRVRLADVAEQASWEDLNTAFDEWDESFFPFDDYLDMDGYDLLDPEPEPEPEPDPYDGFDSYPDEEDYYDGRRDRFDLFDPLGDREYYAPVGGW